MSDRLFPLPLDRLLQWILTEEEQDRIFGVPKDLFFTPGKEDPFRMVRYGQFLETPIGVAAGPHTQLAQNIILAWLCGARYLELKTVQSLDEIDVSKPCIDMQDEGYNCEWSQELLLQQSFHEYLNAWILIHILRDRFNWENSGEPGVILNMSVGYDMAGIQNPNVQQFFDLMGNCQGELETKLDVISGIYPQIQHIAIPSRITNNITLSTMHGCPSQEIESIGKYLMEERHLHTTVKLNPTLLGKDRLRDILNNRLGFRDIHVPEAAFEHDLNYSEAIPLIQNLQKCASSQGVEFGLKLTNTLEVQNTGKTLPSGEDTIYLSGRALHPVSIQLAHQLQTDFNGCLDISFSAGADCFNVAQILACNLGPVTTCTDVLKPGGYGRLGQYLENIKQEFFDQNAESIEEFILSKSGSESTQEIASLKNLEEYAARVLDNPVYQKHESLFQSIKTSRRLEPFDCIEAPCIHNCSAEQDIPAYMYHTAKGDYQKAFEVIMETNPLPGITGYVCDHLCQAKCTRNHYDNPLLIREIKRFVMEQQKEDYVARPAPSNGLKVTVIGAGPSGLTCAYFLALGGCQVDVYESAESAGGMVSAAIPSFRLDEKAVYQDIETIEKLGVTIHYRSAVDKQYFRQLQQEADYIYVAVGAQHNKRMGIPGEKSQGVIDALHFLTSVRQGQSMDMGNSIAVIGGGNTAIDAARTARRMVPDEGRVMILYRRTRKEMPADMDEIHMALEEGIEIRELVMPEQILEKHGKLTSIMCSRMKLGEKDESGRARPVKIKGSEFEFDLDTVITAIGQQVVLDFLTSEDLVVDPVTYQTRNPNIYAGGDAIRGASTVIEAIGDGQQAAEHILRDARGTGRITGSKRISGLTLKDYQKKYARREYGQDIHLDQQRETLQSDAVLPSLTEEQAQKEAGRCLFCDEVCNLCVTVCPNLAQLSFSVEPMDLAVPKVSQKGGSVTMEDQGTFSVKQRYQILNIGDFCNECGNCTTFCPTKGEPFLDKPRFFLSEESFKHEKEGYLLLEGTLSYKRDNKLASLTKKDGTLVYETDDILAYLDSDSLRIQEIRFKSRADNEIRLDRAMEMAILLKNVKEVPLFTQTRTDRE